MLDKVQDYKLIDIYAVTDVHEMAALGIAYYDGRGVEKDLAKATYCLKKAIEQGSENPALKQFLIGIYDELTTDVRNSLLGEFNEAVVEKQKLLEGIAAFLFKQQPGYESDLEL